MAELSKIYANQIESDDDSVQATAREYLSVLKGKDIPFSEFWGIFDMLYLSSSKSEVIRKLMDLIHSPPDEILGLYTQANEKIIQDPPGNFGHEFCDLIASGEMNNIERLIHKSKYYNSQDKLVEDVLYHIKSVS